MRFVGIDPGASAIHCVVMDEARRIVEGRVLPADSPTQLPDIVAGATAIAIDAPAALSIAPMPMTPRCRGSSQRRGAVRSRWAASTGCGCPG
jgi:hypothetical protein